LDKQLTQIRKAYDLTVEQYRQGINPLDNVPDDIRHSSFFQSFQSGNISSNNAAPDIKEYLQPEIGMRYLDQGCSANLVNYHLYEWPCTYYGVDISSALIEAMRNFTTSHDLHIGTLQVAEISKLPFPDQFFDIASTIGVLEYCSLPYVRKALKELARVLHPGSRTVLDIPNRTHPYARDMVRLERFLERPIYLHSRPRFELVISQNFIMDKIDDSGVMIKYFVRRRE
jgi:SAM-dependent methyltransferase